MNRQLNNGRLATVHFKLSYPVVALIAAHVETDLITVNLVVFTALFNGDFVCSLEVIQEEIFDRTDGLATLQIDVRSKPFKKVHIVGDCPTVVNVHLSPQCSAPFLPNMTTFFR